MDEITTSDDPGRYTATSVATYNTALNTAKAAVTAGTADMTTYEGLLAAKNQLVTNPITEGYYFIASAGNGPGYSGGPYEYEDDDAMYNADGIVKWKAYDSTDASQLYYLTQKEDKNDTEHTESLNCKSADGTAAQSNLNGLSDGKRLSCLVGSSYVRKSGTLHTENTNDGTHESADKE